MGLTDHPSSASVLLALPSNTVPISPFHEGDEVMVDGAKRGVITSTTLEGYHTIRLAETGRIIGRHFTRLRRAENDPEANTEGDGSSDAGQSLLGES